LGSAAHLLEPRCLAHKSHSGLETRVVFVQPLHKFCWQRLTNVGESFCNLFELLFASFSVAPWDRRLGQRRSLLPPMMACLMETLPLGANSSIRSATAVDTA
jgi:hypothetical protein